MCCFTWLMTKDCLGTVGTCLQVWLKLAPRRNIHFRLTKSPLTAFCIFTKALELAIKLTCIVVQDNNFHSIMQTCLLDKAQESLPAYQGAERDYEGKQCYRQYHHEALSRKDLDLACITRPSQVGHGQLHGMQLVL